MIEVGGFVYQRGINMRQAVRYDQFDNRLRIGDVILVARGNQFCIERITEFSKFLMVCVPCYQGEGRKLCQGDMSFRHIGTDNNHTGNVYFGVVKVPRKYYSRITGLYGEVI